MCLCTSCKTSQHTHTSCVVLMTPLVSQCPNRSTDSGQKRAVRFAHPGSHSAGCHAGMRSSAAQILWRISGEPFVKGNYPDTAIWTAAHCPLDQLYTRQACAHGDIAGVIVLTHNLTAVQPRIPAFRNLGARAWIKCAQNCFSCVNCTIIV